MQQAQRKIRIVTGVLKVEDVGEFLNRIKFKDCIAVFVDSEYVLDEKVLEFAVNKALRAWNEGRRVAKTIEMEILLYIAATRQIEKAKNVGLKEGLNEVYLILIGNCYDKLKEVTKFKEVKFSKNKNKKKIEKIIEFYGINKNELEIVGLKKLPLLIRERIVLFDLFK